MIISASVAQTIMAGWLLPKKNDTTTEAAKTKMKKRWMRKVPKSVSGLEESPFGVTTNLLLRRSTESISERAYSGADIADIAMPATPPEPSGSCGETLWRRFQMYRPIWSAEALP